jgi:hypothetical protein
MAIGSGLGGSIGIAAESVYGTYVAPTRWFEFDKEDLKKDKATFQGGGIAAGRFNELASRRVLTTTAGSGTADIEVANTGFGLLIAHLLGSSAAPVQQALTTAYLQTHILGDNFGKYMTVQKGVPDTTGTVRPYSFVGGKIVSANFSCGLQTTLMSTIEWDFNAASEAQGLAAPTYSAAGLAPFHGGQMNVKLGSFGAEASIVGVTNFDCKFERAMATDRYYASAAGAPATKLEPIMNDYVKITGNITADYVSKADLADRFAADSSTSLVVEWVGPIIAAANKQTFRIKLPAIFVDTDTPTIEGRDLVSNQYGFTAQYDGTNPLIQIEYMSTDTVI